jgi:hypothetical protein
VLFYGFYLSIKGIEDAVDRSLESKDLDFKNIILFIAIATTIIPAFFYGVATAINALMDSPFESESESPNR